MITPETAKNVLEGLRMIQFTQYSYDDFLKVLKKRIMRYTGNTECMFMNERELVLELGRLGVLQDMNGIGRAKRG
ncbi:hypothetical protein 055SW001_41 [Bacillus phage 055SW001]|nr:hypothetical protein 022DV001_41 [Bacillus phage 022DV001]QFG05442.1 hypothetical protein 031MP003_42 [Bacillus phage 031MP003]QFG05531.1 hypothetical protein 031MP002_41 [Bacillus phage 031MP002]QFG05792.1 hypothetical protein 055SW001_41 [Bacillus phage 055SW001]